jgi:hypothetical protein
MGDLAAEEEILILFSTDNAFRRQEKAGALEMLKEAASRNVKIRILMPAEDNNTDRRAAASRMTNETILQLKELGIYV